LRLQRYPQPTIQKTSASIVVLGLLGYWLRIHLAIKVCQQLDFVVPDRRSILAEIAGAEDAPRKLFELFGFDGAEKSQTDLCPISDLLKRDSRFPSESGKVKAGRTSWRGWLGVAGLFRGHNVLKKK